MSCFILFPLTFTFPRPAAVDGVSGFLFDSLGRFDKPFNQAPSLHIALLVILWDRYARHVTGRARWILHGWFTLIGLSVLTTYQHHFVDIPTGALLGFACPSGSGPRKDRPRLPRTGCPRAGSPATRVGRGSPRSTPREGIAFCAVAVSIGGIGLWLFWPAVSMALVSANYARCGTAGVPEIGDRPHDRRGAIAAGTLYRRGVDQFTAVDAIRSPSGRG